MLPPSRPSVISQCPAAHGRGASGRRRASCRGGGRAAGLAWARPVKAQPLRASRRVGVCSNGSGGGGGDSGSASANDSSGGGNSPRSETELDEDPSGWSGGARRQEQPPVPPRLPVKEQPLRASQRVGVYSNGSGGSGSGGDSASANDSSGGGNPRRSGMELDYDEDSSGRSGGARRQEQPPVPPRPPETSPLTPPFPEVWTPRTVLGRYPRPCGRELRGRGAALARMSKDHRERSGTGLLRSQGAGIRPPTTTTDTTRLATHKTTRAAPCAEGGQERQTGGHTVRTDTPQGRGRVRHGGPRVRVCVKPNKHGTARTAATADNSKQQPAEDRGRSPAHQRRGPHVPQSNGICHWTCARADEPDPLEGSAVTEPVPKPQTAAKPRRHNKRQPGRGQGARLTVPLTPRRHSPHATHHCGETWCSTVRHRVSGETHGRPGSVGIHLPPLPAATEQGPPVPGT